MLRFTKAFLACSLALLLALCAIGALADGQQVFAESFDSSSGELPSGWSYHSYQEEYCYNPAASYAEVVTLEEDASRAGVLHIYSSVDDDAAVFTTVAVQPNTIYRLSCFIKTAGVMCDNADNSGEASGANIALRGAIIARSQAALGTGDWREVQLVGVTGSDQKELTVSCRIGGYSSVSRGEAWFDDFKIEKLDSYSGELTAFYTSADTNSGTEEGGGSAYVLLIILGILALAAAALIILVRRGVFSSDKSRANGKDGELRISEDLLQEDYSSLKSADKQKVSQYLLNKIRGRSIWETNCLTLPEKTDNKLHFVKLDWIFVTALTAVYAVVALLRLGTLNFPTSSWSADSGTTVRIEFAESKVISAVWQNTGVSYSNYTLTADGGETISISSSDDPTSYWHMFKWKKLQVPTGITATTGVTLTVMSGDGGRAAEPDLVINELAFFDTEGKLIPCTVSDVSASAIIDEQSTVPDYPSYYNGMYFDEVYHARTAYEHINNLNVYEWTHPPLGKLIIAVGILIFGMKPFGWRIMGTLFGIAMVPIMYCFGKRFFKRPPLALLSAFLFAFDFMHFSQTRIATVDVYALFFTLLATYYMYQFVTCDVNDGIKRMLKPLALSGLFFGFGCASKWTCIYTGAALAVLFFGKLIWLGIRSRSLVKNVPEHKRVGERFYSRAALLCLWCVLFFVIVPVIIYSASYCRYYTAQWKPAEQQSVYERDPSRGETAADVKLDLNEALNAYINGVVQNQQDMYGYHSKLESEHKASSPWWMWLFNLRPTWFYAGYMPQYTVTFKDWDGSVIWAHTVNYGETAKAPTQLYREGYTFMGWDRAYNDVTANITVNAVYAEGSSGAGAPVKTEKAPSNSPSMAGTISTFGNPAVWNLCFFGTLGLIVCLVFFRKKLTLKAAFLFVCIGAALLPWVLVTRSTYAYHYFSTVPYIILASVYLLKYIEDKTEYNVYVAGGVRSGWAKFVPYIKYAWMVLAVVLFALFYPVISGTMVPQTYIHMLEWVPFRKIELHAADGSVSRTLRMGWTFLSYGD